MSIRMLMLAAALVWAASGACAQMALTISGDGVVGSAAGKPVFEYANAKAPFKPYVKTLCTPSGVQILRDAPHDHLHHHALMYAIGVNGTTLWEETDKGGYEIPVSLDIIPAPPAADFEAVAFSSTLEWRSHDKKTLFANEKRDIALIGAKDLGATMLVWRTRATLPEGVPEITLTGAHYYGLGMRFIESMDDGKFLNATGADGEIVRGDERNFQAAWCAFESVADGKPVTAAMFDSPGNTRPATWFTMGEASPAFSYLAATLHLYKEPLTLKQGEQLDVTYAVVLWDGHADRAAIDRADAWWLSHLEAIKAMLK